MVNSIRQANTNINSMYNAGQSSRNLFQAYHMGGRNSPGTAMGGGLSSGLSGGLGANYYQRPEPEPEPAHITGGGFWRQFGHGAVEPLTVWNREYKAPEATSHLEGVGRIAGRILGWGGAMALTKGVAGIAAAKAGVGISATAAASALPVTKSVASKGIAYANRAGAFGLWSGIRKWGEGEDSPENLLKAAGMGSAFSLAVSGAFTGLKHLKGTPAAQDAIAGMKQKFRGITDKYSDAGLRKEAGEFLHSVQQSFKQGTAKKGTQYPQMPGADDASHWERALEETTRRLHQRMDKPFVKIHEMLREAGVSDAGELLPVGTTKEQKFDMLMSAFRDRPNLVSKIGRGAFDPISDYMIGSLKVSKKLGLTPENADKLNQVFFRNKGSYDRSMELMGETKAVDIEHLWPVGKVTGLKKEIKPGVEAMLKSVQEKDTLRDQFRVATESIMKIDASIESNLAEAGISIEQFLRDPLAILNTLRNQGKDALADALKRSMDAKQTALSVRESLMSPVADAVRYGQDGYIINEFVTNALQSVGLVDKGIMEEVSAQEFMTRVKEAMKKEHGIDDMSQLKGVQADFWKQVKHAVESLDDPDASLGDALSPTNFSQKSPELAKEISKVLGLTAPEDLSISTKEVVEFTSGRSGLFNLTLTAPTRKVLGEQLGRTVRNAKIRRDQFREVWKTEFKKILEPWMTGDPAKNVKIREGIYDIVSKRGPYESGEEALRGMGLPVDVDEAARMDAAAVKLREAFDELKVILNIKGGVDDYMPHIRASETATKGLKSARQTFDDPEFFAHFERMIDPDYRLEKDVWSLAKKYIDAGSAKEYYGPVQEKVQNFFTEMGIEEGHPKYEYWGRLENYLLKTPNQFDAKMDQMLEGWHKVLMEKMQSLGIKPEDEFVAGQSYTQLLSSWFVNLQNMGAMGYSAYTATRNLTQQMLSIFNIADNPIKGLEYWWQAHELRRSPLGKVLSNTLNPLMTGRMPLEGIKAEGLKQEFAMAHDITDFGDMKGYAKDVISGNLGEANHIGAWGYLNDKAFQWFRNADAMNVEVSWLMQFLKSLDEGSHIKHAMEAAHSFASSTQFLYGIDSPELYRHPVGKIIGTFTSWPINWWHLIKEQGGRSPIRAASTMAGMAVGSEWLSRSGLNFSQIHPMQVGQSIFPMSMVLGSDNQPMTVGMLGSTTDALGAMMSGDPEERQEAIVDWARDMGVLVPFMLPGRRVKKALDMWAGHRGGRWTELDDDDRIRRQIEPDRLQEITSSVAGVGIPLEGLLTAYGPTTADKDRYEALVYSQAVDNTYRRLRSRAIDAFFSADYDTFEKYQMKLAEIGSDRMIDESDIEQEMNLRDMQPIERRIRTLPEELRAGVLERTRVR